MADDVYNRVAYFYTMNALRASAVAMILFAAGAAPAGAAGTRSPQALIKDRLHRWEEAFNNRDTAAVCDLFSPHVIATVPDAPSRRRPQVCGNLKRVLAQGGRRLHYSSDIHEIIISGNYAIVRLDWTLRATRNGSVTTTLEHGMDVFQRDRGGTWSIIRFLAFSDAPVSV